jgi:hypothetical protein
MPVGGVLVRQITPNKALKMKFKEMRAGVKTTKARVKDPKVSNA